MMIFRLNADDLSNIRFAFSPVWELVASYWALTTPSRNAVHLPWIHEAHAALEGVDLPYLDALITPEGRFADCLTPAPQTPHPVFEQELARVRQTPPDLVRQDMQRLGRVTPVTQQFLDAPARALDALIDEMQDYWQRTLAHHWPRIQAVLESDVLYRARQLALEGADRVFNDLHHGLHYADRTLYIETRHEAEMIPDGAGLMLVPLVFMWNDVVLPSPDRSPIIAYGARGAGLWTQQAEEPEAALAAAFGAGRAAVLRQLTAPRSTSELAEALGVTPGNISLHIARLHKAGLVESQQISRWVFHRLTVRGEHLLKLFDHP